MSIKRFHRPNCTGGSCQCPWRLDFRPLGVNGPHQRFQFPTKKAAEQYEAENRVKAKRGEYRAPANIPLFAEVAQDWLAEKRDRHPATQLEARNILKHLAPLNPWRLDQIGVATIEKLRDDLLAAKVLAPRSVARVLGATSAIFKEAIRLGYTSSNPAAHAKRPRNPVTEVSDTQEQGALRPDEVLSSAEIGRLLDAAEPGLFHTLFAVAASTGMRSEELGALQWPDIELASPGRLFVRRSLAWTRDADQTGVIPPRLYPTKTKAGNREIPLAPELVSLLRTWKIQCPPSKAGFVFCNEAGLPLRRSYVLHGLYRACARAKLRRCSIKTFRHSAASGWLARRMPITQAQHLLGHANPAVTLRVYSHFIPSEGSDAADRYAAAFLGAGPRSAAQGVGG